MRRVRSAFVGAMDTTLWVCGGVTALAAVLALLFLRPDSPKLVESDVDRAVEPVEVS
jgi:hypothetical protein